MKTQQQGSARREIDARSVGELLFNNMKMMFIEFIKHEAMTMKELLAVIHRQNRTLTLAISK